MKRKWPLLLFWIFFIWLIWSGQHKVWGAEGPYKVQSTPPNPPCCSNSITSDCNVGFGCGQSKLEIILSTGSGHFDEDSMVCNYGINCDWLYDMAEALNQAHQRREDRKNRGFIYDGQKKNCYDDGCNTCCTDDFGVTSCTLAYCPPKGFKFQINGSTPQPCDVKKSCGDAEITPHLPHLKLEEP